MKALLYQLDAMNRKLVAGAMEEHRHIVITATSRQEALDAIENGHINVMLADLRGDGSELIRNIRARERGSHVHTPVVALVAGDTQGNRQRCTEVGADALLPLPVGASELLTVLERLGGHAALDVVAALERIEGDRALLEELLRLFVEECHSSMDQIQEAWRSRDAFTLGRLAHTLKGSSANVGANAVSEAALVLERQVRSGNLENAAKLIADLEQELERTLPQLDSALKQATE